MKSCFYNFCKSLEKRLRFVQIGIEKVRKLKQQFVFFRNDILNNVQKALTHKKDRNSFDEIYIRTNRYSLLHNPWLNLKKEIMVNVELKECP